MRIFSAEILIMRNIKIADSFDSTKSVRIIEVWLYVNTLSLPHCLTLIVQSYESYTCLVRPKISDVEWAVLSTLMWILAIKIKSTPTHDLFSFNI